MNETSKQDTADEIREFRRAVLTADYESAIEVVNRSPNFVREYARKDSESEDSFVHSALGIASEKNCVKTMELLYTLGANIHFYGDRAIQLASRRGSIDAVRWLLDHGADIEGSSCGVFALDEAVTEGHANLVKLILETKGKIVGSRDVGELLKRAKSPEVIELLRPYAEKAGVDVVIETEEMRLAAKAERAGQTIVNYFENRFGKQDPDVVLQQVVPNGIPVAVHTVFAGTDWITLHTSGMSAHEMNGPPNNGFNRAELFTSLIWDDAVDHMHAPKESWVYQWMMRLAQYPFLSNGWIGAPITFITPDPQEFVVPGAQFTGFMAIPDDIFHRETGHNVRVLRVLPVFPEEVAYEKEHGTLKFLHLMKEKEVPLHIDKYRINAVTG